LLVVATYLQHGRPKYGVLRSGNRNYVGMIEREENAPTVDALEQISDALNIDPVILFREN
jgi:transcriptional regulator with XRE-family HTH domain